MNGKIDISNWNLDTKKFLKIENKKWITKNRIYLILENLYFLRLRKIAYDIIKIHYKNKLELDEVLNRLLSICIDYLIKQNILSEYDNFEPVFWYYVKIQTLNFFNKLLNKQFNFDFDTVCNAFDFETFAPEISEISSNEWKFDWEQFLNKLNKEEIKYLKNYFKNTKVSMYSNTKRKELNNSLYIKMQDSYVLS
ncbi:hypothetical protein [Mycoplasma leonicaptivi]|uniref:hypothetical protein n=1 Tax=Mycoplasma leonicaptivi TaxID=36742 RepID=UPI00048310E5|nr:hypothetical protein [Mycoplasma leonicaptivi]